jgi:rfaE bifunctional protein nucleotidyltransferase chain/domain
MSRKIVLANGCFDLFHYGHLLHLEAARKLGDELWVSITADRDVNKGPGRPVYTQEHRAALVRALRCVDGVLISSLMQALIAIKPNVFVKGCDYLTEGLQDAYAEYCETHSIEVVFTDTPKLSAWDMVGKANELRRD